VTNENERAGHLEAIYRQRLLQLFHHPLGTGDPDVAAARGWAKNRTCGDEVTFFSMQEDNSIKNCWQATAGCAIATATASLLVQETPGKTPEECRFLLQTIRQMVFEGKDPEGEAEWKILSAVHQLPSRHECVGVALKAMERSLNPENPENSEGVGDAVK